MISKLFVDFLSIFWKRICYDISIGAKMARHLTAKENVTQTVLNFCSKYFFNSSLEFFFCISIIKLFNSSECLRGSAIYQNPKPKGGILIYCYFTLTILQKHVFTDRELKRVLGSPPRQSVLRQRTPN